MNATATATSTDNKITEGVYWNKVGVFRVQTSKTSGKLYAKQLDPKTGSWSYAPGVIFKLHPGTKISLDIAKAYGLKTGQCLMCGRELTNAESVKAGIGPVCAKGF